MRFSNLKAQILLFVVLALAVNSAAQNSQFSQETNIEDEVVKLLQKRDVGELANELARKKSQTSSEILIKLSVFARAGHRQRVHETLKEIGRDFSSSPNQTQIYHVAKNAAGTDDFNTLKIFYEQIAVNGDDRVSLFFDLWTKNGDVRELEKWLESRTGQSEIWWRERLLVRQRLGTADEIYNELEQKIRENPSDFSLIQKYLQAISSVIHSSIGLDKATYTRDVTWLADAAKTDSAYEAYELGTYLTEHNPSIAIKLFEKSLSLPFTQKDLELLGQRAFRYASITPEIKNPEKQLRYWTKTALAQTYQKNNQPHLAQPIVEDLTAIDTSDIYLNNPFALAGAVQGSSGQRVVESKILQDEAANENSPDYWLKRVSYYSGRKEKELVWQTFIKALAKFEYKPNDLKSSWSRFRILYDLRWFGANYREKETEEILRREFTRAIEENDSDYIFRLARAIGSEFENLLNEFFVNTELLPKVLAARVNWRDEECNLIEDVAESEKWDSKKREQMWNQLTILARKDIKNRAFSLADAMTSESAYKNAVPLLEECLKTAPEEYQGDLNYNREDVERDLFDAYLNVGDWRKAEKMFSGDFLYWGNELGKVAVAAAKSGDINDAVRLWKKSANFDRRNQGSELLELSKTDAKPLLREFYLQMKKSDALTETPDKALQFLR